MWLKPLPLYLPLPQKQRHSLLSLQLVGFHDQVLRLLFGCLWGTGERGFRALREGRWHRPIKSPWWGLPFLAKMAHLATLQPGNMLAQVSEPVHRAMFSGTVEDRGTIKSGQIFFLNYVMFLMIVAPMTVA